MRVDRDALRPALNHAMKAAIIALAGTVVIAGSGTAAVVLTGSSTPTATERAYAPGIYMYTGNGVTDPVPLTGEPSSVPPEIITNPTIDAAGTRINYGIIMVGKGTIPAPYGSYTGQHYQGWAWSKQSAQLSWATDFNYMDNGVTIVVQNVIGHYQSSNELITLDASSGAYATNCLSFVIPNTSGSLFLRLTTDYFWTPVTEC